MEFSDVTAAAWRITRRYWGLWWFGFFGGAATGSCSGAPSFNTNLPSSTALASPFSPTSQFSPTSPAAPASPFSPTSPAASLAVQHQINQALSQVQQVLPILLVLLAMVVVIVAVLWLFSVACRGAVIAGGAQAALGNYMTAGQAWSEGVAAFGRLVLLDFLVVLLWLVTIGAVLLLVIGSIFGQSIAQVDWLRLFTAVASGLGLVAIGGSLLSIVIAFAQRAIVVDRRGVQHLPVALLDGRLPPPDPRTTA